MTGEPTPSIRGFDPTIVEMVRMEANRRRLGDDDGSLARRFGEETERIADAVEVALRWIDAGLLSEAVAYSVDAGNLVKRGLAIEALLASLAEGTAGRTWLGRIPPHRGLDRRAIERLNVAHADVASAEALLAAHRASALEVASPLERMATLDRLRAKLPRNAALAEESEDLEHAIERGLRANLARADRLGDAVEIEQIRAVLASRGWATRIPENLGAEVEAVRRRLVERANSEERQALAARIHAAFAEMDRTALEELETRWNRLGGGDLPDPAIDSAFRWLESQRSADAADLEAARLVVDLERVLDAGLGLEEAEPIASSLARLDRTPPPRIFARLEALRQRDLEERKRRRRRRLLLVGGTALLLIAGTAWVSLRLLEQQAALASAEAADSFARQGEFERAAELIEGLVASNRGDDVLLPSARDRYDALITAATIAIEVDARALSDAQSILAEVDEIAGSVDDSSPLAEQRLAVESALRRLATIEGDRLDATRTARKSELESRLESIDRRLAGSMRETVAELDREAASTPSPSPAASQAALRDALQSIDDLVADARERFAAISAGRGDGDATEAFLDRLAARREAIVVRIAALDAMDLLLAELAAETDDESRFLAAYEKLLSDHGAVLAARGVLEAHERGLEAARSGAAIRHWREIASRSIRAASGDGGWHPEARGDARAVVAAIADHLARFPESPHREAAARHRTYVARLADLPGDAESLRDATIDRLYDSGYGSLFRTPLSNGGFVYRRAGGNGAFDFSITNESELAAPPNRLLPRAGVPAQPSGQTIETMPSRLLGEWMPRLETADPQSIRSTLLGLIDSAARAKEDDPMLQLAFLRMLWRTYAAMPGPSESAPTNWLDDLAASRIGPRGIDFLERSCDGRQALADPRRLALLAIAEAPDARRLAETEDRWWRQSIEGLAPAAASGTLVPVGPDGPLRLNRGGGEWTLVAGRDGVVLVRTAFEGGIASFAGVAAPPAPAQCFER
jgi:hypothetical protein